MTSVLISTVGKNGKANMPPNDNPVSIIENIQSLIFPTFLESGIHSGTDNEEGTMYVRMMSGAKLGLPTTYWHT